MSWGVGDKSSAVMVQKPDGKSRINNVGWRSTEKRYDAEKEKNNVTLYWFFKK